MLLMVANASPERVTLLMAARDAVAPGQLLLIAPDDGAAHVARSLAAAGLNHRIAYRLFDDHGQRTSNHLLCGYAAAVQGQAQHLWRAM